MPTSCPFCLSAAVSENLAVKEMHKGTRDVFDYAICASCASVYITEFPADIARYYEGYYSFSDAIPTIERSRLKLAIAALYSSLVVRSGLSFLLRPFYRCPYPWQMKLLNPNLQAFLFLGAKSDARILDVGSGGGEFVKMMRRFGYARATGIDPFLDETSQNDYARRGDIHSVSGTYDVILFNHSIEHMTDPEAALRRCTDLLAPGGKVLIQIPNIHSLEFTVFKQYWVWLHAPHHFALPSRAGIELLASKCGLRIVDKACTSRPDHYLYSEEYSRDISDCDPNSARRALEDGSFDKNLFRSLARMAYKRNKDLSGDWIAYYLEKA